MVTFTLNGQLREVDVPDDTPLLWVIRESLRMTGTKFGCGIGECGACTVHLNGAAIRSCQFPIAALQGADVQTIEGLSPRGEHALQQAWIEEQVPQCGYCQSGQIMSAAALLAGGGEITDETITAAMSGNICRCGAYNAIKRAIHRAADPGNAARTIDRQEAGDPQ
jgi:aerobic-type carbon monoxide dehydrogenase small subunit (CoxS/CutS family)